MSVQGCMIIFVTLVYLTSAAPSLKRRQKRQTIFFEDELDERGTPNQGTGSASKEDTDQWLSRDNRTRNRDAFGTPAFAPVQEAQAYDFPPERFGNHYGNWHGVPEKHGQGNWHGDVPEMHGQNNWHTYPQTHGHYGGNAFYTSFPFGHSPQYHGGFDALNSLQHNSLLEYAKGAVDESWARKKRQTSPTGNIRPPVSGSWSQNQPGWNEIGNGNNGPDWDRPGAWLGNNNGGAWNSNNQWSNGNGRGTDAWNGNQNWNGNNGWNGPGGNGNNGAWNGNGGAWNGNQKPNGSGNNQNSWNNNNGGSWNGNNQRPTGNGNQNSWNNNNGGLWNGNNQRPTGNGNQNSWNNNNGGLWNGNNQRPNGNGNPNSWNNNNGGLWNGNNQRPNGNGNQNSWNNNNGGSWNGNNNRPPQTAAGDNGNFGNSIAPTPGNNNNRPRPGGNNNNRPRPGGNNNNRPRPGGNNNNRPRPGGNNGNIRPPIAIGGVRPPSTPAPNCDCPATNETNPVCGTDGNTYVNPSRLRCARVCGSDIQQKHYGACTATTTQSTNLRRG